MIKKQILIPLFITITLSLQSIEETKLYAHWKCYQCGHEYDIVPRRCSNIINFDTYKQCDSIVFLYFDSVYRHGTKADPFQEVEWNLPSLKTQ